MTVFSVAQKKSGGNVGNEVERCEFLRLKVLDRPVGRFSY